MNKCFGRYKYFAPSMPTLSVGMDRDIDREDKDQVKNKDEALSKYFEVFESFLQEEEDSV